MRGVIVVLLAVPAVTFSAACSGANGAPTPGPEPGPALVPEDRRPPEPAPKPGPEPGPEPKARQPVARAAAGADGEQLGDLIADATSWFVGSAAGGRARTLPPGTLDDAVQAARPPVPAGNGSGALSMDGGWSAGVVIAPPAHADARPYPLGMVIKPPETKDPMAIPMGCDTLQALRRPRVTSGWRKPFADLAEAADAACTKVL